MRLTMYFVALMAALFLNACSTIGPFVNNISSDGNGGLTIEKCTIRHNGWTGITSMGECTNTNVRIFQTEKK